MRLAQALTIPVIASGGLSNLDDIKALCAVEGRGRCRHHRRASHLRRFARLRGRQKLADELSPKAGA